MKVHCLGRPRSDYATISARVCRRCCNVGVETRTGAGAPRRRHGDIDRTRRVRGVVALIVVELVTVKLVAGVPPIVTADALVKFAPVMTIAVPPNASHCWASADVTVGAGVT